MSYKCTICGKGPTAGKSISHSNRATNRIFRPNLRRQKVVLKGSVTHTLICTRCMRSGKVKKAV